jgi:hypothetical protein
VAGAASARLVGVVRGLGITEETLVAFLVEQALLIGQQRERR